MHSTKDSANSGDIYRLSFTAEWYQEEAGIVRNFLINFYPADQALEVFEQKSRKVFLRRTRMPELTSKDFFIGSYISVFGRQFDIVGFADEATKHCLAKFRTRSFVLLKPSIAQHLGVVLTHLLEADARISEGLMVQFTPATAKRFVSNIGDRLSKAELTNELLSGKSIGLVVIANNILNQLRQCQEQARGCLDEDVHPSMRKLFTDEKYQKGIYSSASEADANRDIAFFFHPNSGLILDVKLDNTTLAVIKPHVIKEGNLGHIITEILNNGFTINVLRMQILERINCEEFFEVYRGILPEYIPLVAELASGVCMAIEIGGKNDTYKEFREFCGPMDTEVAKLLRPNTLRAKFGKTKVKNAIHCTDLREDTVLEIQYFFKILLET